MATLIKVKDLSKEYNKIKAVDSFNINIEKGHIYGVVGPNGAGKTTFFKMLAGLAKPTSGEIEIVGNYELEEYRKRMSFMIEAPFLYHSMTAMENMKIIGGIKGETDDKKLAELLEILKIGKTGKKKVGKFSLGMKQRLGIAGALITNPKVLVLDEPMNGVDPEGIVELREILKKLCKEMGITMLISSHILGELSQLSTDYIFIKEGRIIDQFNKEELKEKESGFLQVGTSDNEKFIPFLHRTLKGDFIENQGAYVRIGIQGEDIVNISRKITDAGFVLTHFMKETIDLEEYYMKRMV